MARVREEPTKVLGGKVPWIYTCYVEPVGHLIAKDVSLPYQTLLDKGSISFKEGEEAKVSPYGSNWLNEKIYGLKKEAICYFTDGSEMCKQEFVGFSCVTAPGEIIHQYRTTKFASIFKGEALAVLKTLEIISESQGESFYLYSNSRSVHMWFNKRSLTKNTQY